MKVKRGEVLRYLGYKNQTIDLITDSLLEECQAEANSLSTGRYTYKFFGLKKSDTRLHLTGSNLIIDSRDLCRHLNYSTQCIVMALTLGLEIEKRINYYTKLDLTRALILDACASALIESICDQVQAEIANCSAESGLVLTTRYSPGYGDLSLDLQPKIINILEAYHKIGLSVTRDCLLLPRKSITAFIGLQKEVAPIKETNKCDLCPELDCAYRREGGSCGPEN